MIRLINLYLFDLFEGLHRVVQEGKVPFASAANDAGAASGAFRFSNEPVGRADGIRLINLYVFGS